MSKSLLPKDKSPALRSQSSLSKSSKEKSKESGSVKVPPKFGFSENAPAQTKGGLLDDTKLKSAKAWYGRRTADFSTEVIKEIQGKLQMTASGVLDNATLQAIAKFQKSVGQSADGKLGAKTLPMLFPHGLATSAAQEEYVKDYLGVDWSKLKTSQERGDKMMEYINKQLKFGGAPECGLKIEALDGDSGHFDFSDWSVHVDDGFLGNENLTKAQLDDFANTIIHEARHSEQWWNMAQLRAGEGKTPKEIAAELGIPLKVAKAAAKDPIKPKTSKAAIARNWYESVYGKGSAHREKTLGDTGTYEDYRNLPEEHDAWRIGDEFDSKLKEARKKEKVDAKKKKKNTPKKQ